MAFDIVDGRRPGDRRVTLTIGQLRRVVSEAIQAVAGQAQGTVEPRPRDAASMYSRDVVRRYADAGRCGREDHWARAIVEEASDGSETLVFQGAEVARCVDGRCEALPGWDASPASQRVVSEFMASRGAKPPRKGAKPPRKG